MQSVSQQVQPPSIRFPGLQFPVMLVLFAVAGCITAPISEVAYQPSTADPTASGEIRVRGQSATLRPPWLPEPSPATPVPTRKSGGAGHAGPARVSGTTLQSPSGNAPRGGHALSRAPVVISASVETTREDQQVRAWTDPESQNVPPGVGIGNAPDMPPTGPMRPSRAESVAPSGQLKLLRPNFGTVTETTDVLRSPESTTNSRISGVMLPELTQQPILNQAAESSERVSRVVNARTWTALSESGDLSDGSGAQMPAPTPGFSGPSLVTDDQLEGELPVVFESGAVPAGEVPELNALSAESAGDSTVPTVPLPNGVPVPEREQSMLQRFRDLYAPRIDQNPGDAALRQLRRLQSPWNLFGDRDSKPAAALPSAPAGGTQTVAAPLSPEDSDTESALRLLISQTETELANWPRDNTGAPQNLSEWRRRQTDLRLLYAVAREAGSAVSTIPDLPPNEQEFWQSLMLALAYYRSEETAESRDQNRAAALEQLRIAVRRLQEEAPLEIRRLTFCSAIHGFGSLDAFPSATFRPGEPVLLYAELQNFGSRHTSTGTYRAEFAGTLEIRREGTVDPLETIRLPSIVDESISERTDFYQSYELTVPGHLRPGRYTVRLIVRDKTDQQTATSDAAFDVR